MAGPHDQPSRIVTTEEHNETWPVAGRLRRSRGDHQRRRPRIELGSQAGRPGLGSVWLAQMASYDALAVASAVDRAVPRISVGTAVVPIYPGTRRYSRLRLRPPKRPPVAGFN
jgi:hypothetical protein